MDVEFLLWALPAAAAIIAFLLAKYAAGLNWLWSMGIAVIAALSGVVIFYASMTATDVVIVDKIHRTSN